METATRERYVATVRLIRGRASHVVVDSKTDQAELLCTDELDAETQAAQLNRFAVEDAAYLERQR